MELNLEKLGLPVQAIVRMSANSISCGRLSAMSKDWPEVLECSRVTGSDSVIMRVAVPSVAQLEDFIDRISAFGTSNTSIVLSSPVTSRVIGAASREARVAQPV